MKESKLLIIVSLLVVTITIAIIGEVQRNKSNEVLEKDYISYNDNYNIKKIETENEIKYGHFQKQIMMKL